MSPRRLAISLMIAQGILFAVETAAIHHIGSGASVLQLAFIRGFGGVVLAIVLAGGAINRVMITNQWHLQVLRGGVSLLYLWVMVYSFTRLPFADATAISYSQAAYIAGFSALVLREPVTRSQWSASAIGIIGVLLIAKPAFANWNAVYAIALIGTSLNGLAFVLNRYLQRQDTELTTMFYTNVVMALGSAPALVSGGLPAPGVLIWLPCLLVLGPIGMYGGIVALRLASASLLGPYTLIRLVVSVFIGAAMFRELPDIVTMIGVAMVVASCLGSSVVGTPMKLDGRIRRAVAEAS